MANAWHVYFGWLLEERSAPGIEVRSEVPLGAGPQRTDFVLLRRKERVARRDREARVLRGLWPRVGREALLEFKSVSRPFASRDLERLLGYGLQWWVRRRKQLPTHADLTLVLAVAVRTRTLLRAAARLRWTWRDLGGGYHALDGAVFAVIVVELDRVAESEHDGLVGAFGHLEVTDMLARRWFAMHTGSAKGSMRVEELEDFDEVVAKFVAKLTPEQRLAGLAPEQRLAGLANEDVILALPDEVLRGLTDEFVERLQPALRRKIRARLKR